MPSKVRMPDGTFVSAATVADVSKSVTSGTIPTTVGATDAYLTVPVTGVLSAAQVTPLVALAASDTNYLTFTITNLGLDGTGTTVMLAATAPNTTKVTGGTALAVNTQRAFAVHGTAANLAVVKGQRLKISATATVASALANTVTVPEYMLSFKRNV